MTEPTTFSKEFLKGVLTAGPVIVKFVKTDGSDRIMSCTTNTQLIESRIGQNHASIALEGMRAENDNVIRVFDIEKNAWRSFRVDSVYHVEA